MIDLYTSPTPNGYKASVTLEELELSYNCTRLGQSGDQKKPEFLAMNPNGRIPAIIDRDFDDLPVFESGAIMIRLAEKTGKLLPTGQGTRPGYQLVDVPNGWHRPDDGQAMFFPIFSRKNSTCIDRYQNEVRRLFEVMDTHLAEHEWLADDFSIADIANWCWTRTAKWSGVESRDLEHLSRWSTAMSARPKCQAGVKSRLIYQFN